MPARQAASAGVEKPGAGCCASGSAGFSCGTGYGKTLHRLSLNGMVGVQAEPPGTGGGPAGGGPGPPGRMLRTAQHSCDSHCAPVHRKTVFCIRKKKFLIIILQTIFC